MPKRNRRGQFVRSKRRVVHRTTHHAAPRRSTMPRRRTYRRYARRARSSARGMLGGSKGKLMNVLAGALGGVAGKFGGSFNATWGPPLGMGAVGYLMNNDTLLTLTGMSLANVIPIPGGSGGTGGGWY
jgi:hypothetical protein